MDCLEKDLKTELGHTDSRQLLALYGAFRQALCGDNTTLPPSVFNVESRLKWQAWNDMRGLNKKNAVFEWLKYYQKLYSQYPHIFAKIAHSNLETYEPFSSYDVQNEKEIKEILSSFNLLKWLFFFPHPMKLLFFVAENMHREKSKREEHTCECSILEWLKKEKGESKGTQIHELICEIQNRVREKEKRFKDLEMQWAFQLSEIGHQYATIKSKHNDKERFVTRMWLIQTFVEATKRHPAKLVMFGICLVVLILCVKNVVFGTLSTVLFSTSNVVNMQSNLYYSILLVNALFCCQKLFLIAMSGVDMGIIYSFTATRNTEAREAKKPKLCFRLATQFDSEGIAKLLHEAFPDEPLWRNRKWWTTELRKGDIGVLLLTHSVEDDEKNENICSLVVFKREYLTDGDNSSDILIATPNSTHRNYLLIDFGKYENLLNGPDDVPSEKKRTRPEWLDSMKRGDTNLPPSLKINSNQKWAFIHITDVATHECILCQKINYISFFYCYLYLSSYRKKGMAYFLLEELIQLYKSGTKFALEVNKNNTSAKHLYNTLGFRTIKQVINYYGENTIGEKMIFVVPTAPNHSNTLSPPLGELTLRNKSGK
ncbi:hypothetical protein RFI_16673 [Reticulomyxa filosa]|uniref:N-acetyltransferase domain-containing protein n=1 Tax=Reticulomyxa filosa TaxID=46433 RepID=X6N5G3_RETFI|nr:hypothetical protein RFI_16673 [Reticulomyxa filosa]|eukprot:ETO20547.1 hypothetical protein RFI_16673 [Reticulomyxa filosa]